MSFSSDAQVVVRHVAQVGGGASVKIQKSPAKKAKAEACVVSRPVSTSSGTTKPVAVLPRSVPPP